MLFEQCVFATSKPWRKMLFDHWLVWAFSCVSFMIHFLKPALAWDNHVLSQVQTFFIRGMLQRTSIVIFKQGIGTMIKYYAKLFIYLFIILYRKRYKTKILNAVKGSGSQTCTKVSTFCLEWNETALLRLLSPCLLSILLDRTQREMRSSLRNTLHQEAELLLCNIRCLLC